MIYILTKVLLLIVLFFIGACSGMKFLRILGINKESNLELFVLSAASGFALISEGLLFLGMIGFFTPMTLCLGHWAIVTNPTFFPSFFPSNGELLFSLASVIGGPVMVNLTHFGFALLTVMALYVYTQKYFERENALIPGVIYLTSPVINSWGTMAYTCNILGFYLLILSMLLMECNKEIKVNKVAFLP